MQCKIMDSKNMTFIYECLKKLIIINNIPRLNIIPKNNIITMNTIIISD